MLRYRQSTGNGLNKKKSIERMMRKEDGNRYESSKENAQVFWEHFKKLYKRASMYDRFVLELSQEEPVISAVDHPLIDDELLKAVNSIKNNAPGVSSLSSQMFKAIDSTNQIYKLLKSIILHFCENKLPSDQWETGLLKIIPKKETWVNQTIIGG